MAHRGELEAILAEAALAKTQAEWSALFVEWDVPGAPINDIAAACEDPQVLHRRMVTEIDHPTAGRFRASGNPIKMGQEERFAPPPTLGQHTQEVLREVAGYTDAMADALEAAQAG